MSEQLTQLEFANLVRDIFDACARRDYAWAIQHFAENVNYADPTRYVNRNRAELLHFFEDDGGFEQRTVAPVERRLLLEGREPLPAPTIDLANWVRSAHDLHTTLDTEPPRITLRIRLDNPPAP